MKASSRAKSNLAEGVVRGQNTKGNPEVVLWGLMVGQGPDLEGLMLTWAGWP